MAQKKPWKEFRQEVLALYEPPVRTKSAWFKARRVLDLAGSLGPRSTADLTPALVSRFVRIDPEWADATVKGYLAYLSPICKYAKTMEYLRVNPFDVRKDWYAAPEAKDDGPEGDGGRRRHLTLDEVSRLLVHAQRAAVDWKAARTHAMIALFAYTGLRRNEGLGLLVADIDLHARIIHLRPRKGRRFKTRASAAPVPMPESLCSILAGWLPRTGSLYALPNVSRTGPWMGGQVGSRPFDHLRAAGEAAGVGRVNFLVLRHTFATMSEYWGLGEMMLQRILRHTTVRTQRHYKHADLANMAEAVRTIEFRPRAEGVAAPPPAPGPVAGPWPDDLRARFEELHAELLARGVVAG